MLQAVINQGKVSVKEVADPVVGQGEVLIRVSYSAISPGTESAAVESTAKSVFEKVREKPRHLATVASMAVEQGVRNTIDDVKSRLNAEFPVGYSVSGLVERCGAGVSNLSIGDKVVAVGARYARHAEYVTVPQNLVIRLADDRRLKECSTAALGGIAMQGVRRSGVVIGDYCVVYGVGVLGLIAVQLLSKAGCRVCAVDINDARLELAQRLGAELALNPLITNDVVSEVRTFSDGHGADSVLFCAATSDSKPLSQAFRMLRKRGNLTLVGVSGMQLNREDMYTKELELRMSTSYGPGRYDPLFEEAGLVYPRAFVRWTERENIAEYLRLVQNEQLDIESLIGATYDIRDVESAFASLGELDQGRVINVISYLAPSEQRTRVIHVDSRQSDSRIRYALVGAGGFSKNFLLPEFRRLNSLFELHTVVDRTGLNAAVVAEQYKARASTCDIQSVLQDDEIDLIVIATRHDNHADLVIKSLENGKHTYVEKPLAVSLPELRRIEELTDSLETMPVLTVGYNRRFSPTAKIIRQFCSSGATPAILNYRVNAGHADSASWIHKDGGRIVGEFCHMIDFVKSVMGANPQSFDWQLSPASPGDVPSDNLVCQISFNNGSLANLFYTSWGNQGLAKEVIEIHAAGRSLVVRDYKQAEGYGMKVPADWKPGKGYSEELQTLATAIKTGELPIGLEDLFDTSMKTFSIAYGD